MPRIKSFMFGIFIAFPIICGCAAYSNQYSTPNPAEIAAQRRQTFVNTQNLTSEQQQAILNGNLFFGMTREQVIAAWGNPAETKSFGSAEGIQEIWIYYSPFTLPNQTAAALTPEMQMQLYKIYLANRKYTYLYFDNGVYRRFEER